MDSTADDDRAVSATRAPWAAGNPDAAWDDIPALSWLLDPRTARLDVRMTYPVSGKEPGPPRVLHEELSNALVRQLKSMVEPVRTVALLKDSDGVARHFFIVGFPVRHDGIEQLAGVAIDMSRHQARLDELVHQALVDDLTGLYNRRGFMLFAEHELKVARRRGTQSAIVYVDVDDLREVNEAGGHAAGDVMLAATGALLRAVFRECDVIGRIGGDEFAVFAADVRGDPALLQMRLQVAARDAAGSVPLSVSVGVGAAPPDPALRLDGLLEVADRAMYRDKARKAARR